MTTKKVVTIKRRSIGKTVNSPARRGNVSPTKRRRRSGLANPVAAALLAAEAGTASGGGGGSNIRVAVRVRPENAREENGDFRNIIDVVDDKLLVFDPKTADDGFYFHGKRQGRRDLNKKTQRDHKFAFDCVFGPEADNQRVFEGTTDGLIDTIFNGYNCSIFVYGATGAGKTFTMLGSKDNPGITYRTVLALYDRIELKKEEISCEIAVSYLEIYNETVIDLINPGTQLNIREDGNNGVNIPGLSRHKPGSPQDLLKLLQYGNSNRSQHPTDANAESSRSHAVFQVFLKQQDRSAGLSADVKISKLSMIDLAGSERGTATSSRGGARLREGANINKSLLALGNCINALAEGSKYIPYRNSKLTRLLKDSIGGNCQTVMISNISPSSISYEDTYNTLKYADRAKRIKVKLRKNIVSVDFHVAQYAKIVEDLKEEISNLKEKLRLLEEENAALKNQVGEEIKNESVDQLKAQIRVMEDRQKEYDDLQCRLRDFEESENVKGIVERQKELTRKLSRLDSTLKLNSVKILHHKMSLERVSSIYSVLKNKIEEEHSVNNLKKAIRYLENKRGPLEREMTKIRLELVNNATKLQEAQKLEHPLLSRAITAELQLEKRNLQVEHVLQFAKLLTYEHRKVNDLLLTALPQFISSHLALKCYDQTPDNVLTSRDEQFEAFISRIRGRTVVWDNKLISSNIESTEDLLGAPEYANGVNLELSVNESSEQMEVDELPEQEELIEDVIVPSPVGDDHLNIIEEEEEKPTVKPRPPTPPRATRALSTPSPPKLTCAFPLNYSDNEKDVLNSTVVIEPQPEVQPESNPPPPSSNSKPEAQLDSTVVIESKSEPRTDAKVSIDPKPEPQLDSIDVAKPEVRRDSNVLNESEPTPLLDPNVAVDQKFKFPLDTTITVESKSEAYNAGPQLDATVIIDQKPESPMDAMIVIEPGSETREKILLEKVEEEVEDDVFNSTVVIESSSVLPSPSRLPMRIQQAEPNGTHVVRSNSPEGSRRDTFLVSKPTVVVQPYVSTSPATTTGATSAASSVVSSGGERMLVEPKSRTPPAGTTMTTATMINNNRRRLKSSTSTSRLLTAADLRNRTTANNHVFKRPGEPVSASSSSSSATPSASASSSSGPNYMASTTAFVNRLQRARKENQIPSNSSSSSLTSPAQPSSSSHPSKFTGSQKNGTGARMKKAISSAILKSSK